MSWKKIIICCLVFIFALSGSGVAAAETTAAKKPAKTGAVPAVLETTAAAAILYDPLSGKSLWEKEPDQRLPMASVTKLMTLLLAVEAVENGGFKLEDRVVASENAWEMGGSQIYLEPGEEMSFWEMLLAVGLQSANDGSVAVAEHIAGSEEAFVQAMNEKAQALGLADTHFVNCHGLPAEDHYTTARDMAVILKEGMKYPLFRKITAMKEFDLRGGAFKLWNTNKLLWWYDGADAGKTGWTEEAKYCLASSAERDGLRLICVVLGVSEPKGHFNESTKIYNYGFARFKAVNMAQAGEKAGELKVGKGRSTSVDVVTAEKAGVVVPRGEEKGFSAKVELPRQIDAPVRKGQAVGSYVVLKNDQAVLRVKLLAKEDVPKASFLKQMERVVDGIF